VSPTLQPSRENELHCLAAQDGGLLDTDVVRAQIVFANAFSESVFAEIFIIAAPVRTTAAVPTAILALTRPVGFRALATIVLALSILVPVV